MTNKMNDISDDELLDVFGDEDTDDTQQTETEDDVLKEETDEDVQNLLKEPKQQESRQDSDVDPSNKTQQRQQHHNPRAQDLTDANGNVIARAGVERRFYEENQRMKQEMANFNNTVLPQIRQQYHAMETELSQYKGVVEGLKAQDLSPQDIQSGLDFVRNWKQDPMGVVKFLLTTLQTSGINVDIDGINMSSQTQAIKQLIDEKFAPFIQEREEAERIAQEEAAVEEDYNAFISQYPDSVVHDKALAFMIRKNPSLTPEVAYLQLKNYYLRNNLDFTKSLEEITLETRKTPNTGIPQSPRVSDNIATNKRQQRIASVGTSMNDIIKGAMTDAGF